MSAGDEGAFNALGRRDLALNDTILPVLNVMHMLGNACDWTPIILIFGISDLSAMATPR